MRAKTSFSCQSCGHQSPRWIGRCPDCGGWNTSRYAAKTADARAKGELPHHPATTYGSPHDAPLAGTTVVPAFRDLAEFLLSYLNVPPDTQ